MITSDDRPADPVPAPRPVPASPAGSRPQGRPRAVSLSTGVTASAIAASRRRHRPWMPGTDRLPSDLRARPFTVAEALARGVPRRGFDHWSLRRPFIGVRINDELPDDLLTLCRAASLVLPPGAAFSHRTAVALWDLPRPLTRTAGTFPPLSTLPSGQLVLTVAAPRGPVAPRRRGLEVCGRVDPSTVVRVRGVPAVSLEVVWCDVAPTLGDVDAIVLGNAVVSRRRGPGLLLAEVERRAGGRGVVRLRALVPRLRWPVRSPMETVWRLDVAAAGIPEPLLNAPIHDGAGGWRGAPDLQWPEVRVASEYDGDGHLTSRRRWREDVARQALMEDEGWWVQRVTAADVGPRSHAAIDRLWRTLHERGLRGLPPRPGGDQHGLSSPRSCRDARFVGPGAGMTA